MSKKAQQEDYKIISVQQIGTGARKERRTGVSQGQGGRDYLVRQLGTHTASLIMNRTVNFKFEKQKC